MTTLEILFSNTFGHRPDKITRLAGAGSAREYYRLTSPSASVVGTIGVDIAENDAFLYFSDYLGARNIPVPRILAVNESHDAYLQDDLGDTSLYDVISEHGLASPMVEKLLRDTLDTVAKVHSLDTEGLRTDCCFPRAEMDARSIMWDLNYFKYCFLKPAGVAFDENLLQDEFELIAERVTGTSMKSIILRDFQSRNIMINNGRPFIIDFQGARIGPALYDVASFLWQARIGMPEEMKWRYAEAYIESAENNGLNIGDNWRGELRVIALFRMLQVLGAYGFRGLIEHKSKFITPIPFALENVSLLLGEIKDMRLQCLAGVIDSLLASERFKPINPGEGLTVKVISFSYKKGIPDDFSGNGGGFVFDCRALHNPGRYDEYKKLTGNDEPVIKFLEEKGEIQQFLSDCYSLVDKAVENYIDRGFSSLMVCFGCTGGRHRSLYSAEHTARHIADRYDCKVRLIHREQNIDKTLK